MEDNFVVNYLYALLEIPSDETATSLKDVLVARLVKDEIYDAFKQNIVGFVSDSASVMVSSNLMQIKWQNYSKRLYMYICISRLEKVKRVVWQRN